MKNQKNKNQQQRLTWTKNEYENSPFPKEERQKMIFYRAKGMDGFEYGINVFYGRLNIRTTKPINQIMYFAHNTNIKETNIKEEEEVFDEIYENIKVKKTDMSKHIKKGFNSDSHCLIYI